MRGNAAAGQPAEGATRIGVRAALVLCGFCIGSVAAHGAARAVDLDAARQQFVTSCGVCHVSSADDAQKRQGPNLYGVYGRHVAARPDFDYSATLKAGTWTWDEAALDRWIENAQEAHPGTIMVYRQADPEKRGLIIAFLKSQSKPVTDQAKAP